MKIALIIPRNSSDNEKSFYDLKFASEFLFSKKTFSYLLAIPTLAALTPPEHEVRVFDENIEDIDYDWSPDLAGITVRTMFAERAYSISESFRKRGVKTVLGGIHSSMCTEEALQHCDSVVIGEAEDIWPKLLADARNGNLNRIYAAEGKVDLTSFPVPHRRSLAGRRYLSDVLQTTKGCPYHCEFCSVHAFDGQRIRHKAIEQVILEIKQMNGTISGYKRKAIFFADDNFIANKKFARELLSAIKPYKIKWSCQASINIAKEDEILALMKESGCGAILIGLESVSEKNLSCMDKGINRTQNYIEAIKKIQSYGILVNGSFILGYDFDIQASFNELINFVEDTRLLMPLINILTPYPGTKLFNRLEKEGRIIHKDWSRYDSKNVVFSPSLMTPEQLLEGHRKVIRHIYSFDSIYRKLRYYWDIDFWKHANEDDPIKFKYRFLFALRLITLLLSFKLKRSWFVLKILPKVFHKRVRISTILTLMAYNDYAYSS